MAAVGEASSCEVHARVICVLKVCSKVFSKVCAGYGGVCDYGLCHEVIGEVQLAEVFSLAPAMCRRLYELVCRAGCPVPPRPLAGMLPPGATDARTSRRHALISRFPADHENRPATCRRGRPTRLLVVVTPLAETLSGRREHSLRKAALSPSVSLGKHRTFASRRRPPRRRLAMWR